MSNASNTDESAQTKDKTILQLKALQSKYKTDELLDQIYTGLMLKHQDWSKDFGPTVSGIALQEVLVAVVGRVISLSQDPIQVIQSFEQMLLNTVAYYVNRQTRPDALQILSGLIQFGAHVPSVSEQQRKS